MANVKGPSNIRNAFFNGKHSLLPPKSPFPSISPSYIDYVPSPAIGPKSIAKPREINPHHQRTSSESFLMEEQPLWLDELLNEPETPIHKGGHRRSSSDSFAYIDVATASTVDYLAHDEYKYKNMISVPAWGSQEFEHYRDVRHASFYPEPNSLGKLKNWTRDPSLISMAHSSGLPSARDNVIIQSSGSSCVLQEVDGVPFTTTEKQDPVESGPHDPKATSEKKDPSHAKLSASEMDTKRAKQFDDDLYPKLFYGLFSSLKLQGFMLVLVQRKIRPRLRILFPVSRVPNISRNINQHDSVILVIHDQESLFSDQCQIKEIACSSLAEGSEFSAELEFLNQQNLILTMENKALKQRLESLAQEQLIKYCKFSYFLKFFELYLLLLLGSPQLRAAVNSFTYFHPETKTIEGFMQWSMKYWKEKLEGCEPCVNNNNNCLLVIDATISRDHDSQFANLSLKHRDTSSGRDPLHI
ncbi:hypothetical protein TEA_009479 [Camellia sinensis var. sinensis]|uniref:Uncharacterized protein n=1 Tax=Camellia sinensis var. sinensis TaxID=542762 RepID=A0A4S4CX89_CAMSN|nr:hypothetical protein TEA_009479 [Camellia sinensis var. sinensis]